jgi:hypothetical protein
MSVLITISGQTVYDDDEDVYEPDEEAKDE